MVAKRARLYDMLAFLAAIAVVALDQWTKSLVVENLSPPGSKPDISLLGPYFVVQYIQNNGAAFSFFANSTLLIILIMAAIAVVAYLYIRMLNSGPLIYKLILGLIVGGAAGNLLDRARHGGYVVDFLAFRIPELNYRFAIFNVADAFISVSVVLLFLLVVFGGWRQTEVSTKQEEIEDEDQKTASQQGSEGQATVQD
ncbi:signal peptidase II [Ktedonospora formicarum]|uniref:Lipoprotein signal peptidase n=1 Tax=Ktedonospora formicarum TaxID=2778364 RepID=A0A8J3HV46_9CHLR|nr:signal peptidase II [Ktedonospora formicarum]GHO42526.1 lipoprotein signal peptidase [Ktedonospora formicarum]